MTSEKRPNKASEALSRWSTAKCFLLVKAFVTKESESSFFVGLTRPGFRDIPF